MLEQELWDPYASSTNISSLRGGDQQVVRPNSQQQQEAGLIPARVKPKGFPPYKAAKHNNKIIWAWTAPVTANWVMLVLPTHQEPSHPSTTPHSNGWLTGMSPWAGSSDVSHHFRRAIYTSSMQIKIALTHYCQFKFLQTTGKGLWHNLKIISTHSPQCC